MNVELGRRLKHRRKELRLSLATVAHRSELSESEIEVIENGPKHELHFEDLLRIAGSIEISDPYAFFEGIARWETPTPPDDPGRFVWGLNNAYPVTWEEVLAEMGRLLARLRERAGMDRQELAERSRLSFHEIQGIESGREPGAVDLFHLAAALRTEPARFFEVARLVAHRPPSPRDLFVWGRRADDG
jgi:transcriptional regulator with XRE-family HTH domain